MMSNDESRCVALLCLDGKDIRFGVGIEYEESPRSQVTSATGANILIRGNPTPAPGTETLRRCNRRRRRYRRAAVRAKVVSSKKLGATSQASRGLRNWLP